MIRRRTLHPAAQSLVFCALLLMGSKGGIAASTTLAWDPVDLPVVAGYMLHYGTVSGNYSNHVDVGSNTSYTLTGLAVGSPYYAVATSYDLGRAESSPSNEIGWVPLTSGNAPVPSATPSAAVNSSAAAGSGGGGSGSAIGVGGGGGGCVAQPGNARDSTLTLLLGLSFAFLVLRARRVTPTL
jgi:hypothetical protein